MKILKVRKNPFIELKTHSWIKAHYLQNAHADVSSASFENFLTDAI